MHKYIGIEVYVCVDGAYTLCIVLVRWNDSKWISLAGGKISKSVVIIIIITCENGGQRNKSYYDPPASPVTHLTDLSILTSAIFCFFSPPSLFRVPFLFLTFSRVSRDRTRHSACKCFPVLFRAPSISVIIRMTPSTSFRVRGLLRAGR